MPKYLVRVFEPTIYEIEAGSAQEAEEAIGRYKEENDICPDCTWVEPEVQVAEIP
jgi:hypothetical protein